MATATIARIAALLEQEVPDDYAAVRTWRDELQSVVDAEIIRRLEPAFNQALASAPHDSLDMKQHLTRWANAELRETGMAVRCPKTGEPAALRATPGNHHDIGRFQIELLHGNKTTVCLRGVPAVELIPRPTRFEPLAEYWRNQVSSKNALTNSLSNS